MVLMLMDERKFEGALAATADLTTLGMLVGLEADDADVPALLLFPFELSISVLGARISIADDLAGMKMGGTFTLGSDELASRGYGLYLGDSCAPLYPYGKGV